MGSSVSVPRCAANQIWATQYSRTGHTPQSISGVLYKPDWVELLTYSARVTIDATPAAVPSAMITF